jgi:hypothetical protein
VKKTSNNVPILHVLMGVLLLGGALVGVIAHTSGATVDDDAVPLKALDDAGYSKASILTRKPALGWEGCGSGDGSVFTAKAVNPVGKDVTVLVCCGGNWIFKSCTVRSR